jgi:hypothetical protein
VRGGGGGGGVNTVWGGLGDVVTTCGIAYCSSFEVGRRGVGSHIWVWVNMSMSIRDSSRAGARTQENRMALEASSRLQYHETQLWNRVFLIIRWCIGCSTMGCALAE